jgi:hypothetical protein
MAYITEKYNTIELARDSKEPAVLIMVRLWIPELALNSTR